MKFFKFVKKVFSEFSNHNAAQQSAAFAYIAIFSIGPLLLVLISIVGIIFGERAASGQLNTFLNNYFGENTAKSIQSAIAHTHQAGGNMFALIIGTIGILLGAIGLTNQLQKSFDDIYSVVPDHNAGIKRTFYIKLKNLSLLLIGGLALVASIVLSTLVSGLGLKIKELLGVPGQAIELINSGVSFLLFIAILYLIYKAIPNVIIPRRIVLATALIISILFLIGKVVLGIVIGHNGTASAYGAAASLVTLLLWFYYSAQILLLGADGIKVYGDEKNLTYKVKKFTLRQKTYSVYTKDDVFGRLFESFANGFKKKRK